MDNKTKVDENYYVEVIDYNKPQCIRDSTKRAFTSFSEASKYCLKMQMFGLVAEIL